MMGDSRAKGAIAAKAMAGTEDVEAAEGNASWPMLRKFMNAAKIDQSIAMLRACGLSPFCRLWFIGAELF